MLVSLMEREGILISIAAACVSLVFHCRALPCGFEGTLYAVWILTLYQLHVFHILSPVGCLYFNFVYSFFQHEFMKLNLLNILRLQDSLSCF